MGWSPKLVQQNCATFRAPLKRGPDLKINLADQAEFTRFLGDPGLLRRISTGHKRILVDEVQRLPSILNTIQALIDEDKSKQFLLTGSSARKLRRGNANLPFSTLVLTDDPSSPANLMS
jgi:hypothetical protein